MTTEVVYDKNMDPIFIEVAGPVAEAKIEPEEKEKAGDLQATGDGMVSIIVLCWNQLVYTKTCIESIKRHTAGDRYQLIVVDNGSEDETLQYLASMLSEPQHIVIRNPKNRGFSGGNNQALRLAEYEYVLFLNNDCRVLRDDWLEVMIGATEGADLVGASCMKVRMDLRAMRSVCVGKARESDDWSYLEGWCLFGRRELFQRLDGFDMRFNPAYSEDADLSFRVKRMGLKIKVADIPVEHFGNKSERLIRRTFGDQSGKSNKLLFEKWVGVAEQKANPAKKAQGTAGKPTILIRRKGAKGDVLMLTPILRELKKKYPDSFLVVQTECPDVLAGSPYVDRAQRYVRSPERYDLMFEPKYEEQPEANAIDVMAGQCGVTLESRKMEIVLGENEVEWAKGKVKGRVCIAAHTGRSWESREWPIERFQEVFRYYADRGYSVLELGDGNTLFTGVGMDLRRCSIKQAAALIGESVVFVGIDSVCANLAKAVGTPACIVYGCVDPASRKADAVEYPIWVEDLECKGCRNRTSSEYVECTKPEVYCLTMVSPEMVIKALRRVIE